MYAFGMPVGILVDAKGPRPAALLGSIMLALGYFPLHLAYDKGSGSVALMCLYSFLSGLGGCTAFAAAVKTSALNWPHHRGTATAFPLAAFGLSAFFFSLIGGFLFPGDTGDFLLLLAYGTAGMTFLGFWFLRVIPHHGSYQTVAADEDESKVPSDAHLIEPGRSSRSFPTTSSSTLHTNQADQESGTAAAAPKHPYDLTSGRTGDGDGDGQGEGESSRLTTAASSTIVAETDDSDETSSLVSSKGSSVAGEVYVQNVDMDRSHLVDIRGWQILRSLEFWQFFAIMGILAGIGLMTIK